MQIKSLITVGWDLSWCSCKLFYLLQAAACISRMSPRKRLLWNIAGHYKVKTQFNLICLLSIILPSHVQTMLLLKSLATNGPNFYLQQSVFSASHNIHVAVGINMLGLKYAQVFTVFISTA